MSPENPKHILTAHDLSNLRTLQSVATTAIPVSGGNSSYHHSNNNTTTNMVLSTIPLDGHAVVIQQSHLLPTTTAASIAASQQQQQQQRSSATTTSNGFNSNTLQSRTTTNNISNLIATATATLQPTTKAAVLNSSNSSNMSTNNNGMHSIPASSKYVFLQQNGNGQYTTYEGTTSTTGNNVGNIVLLATEPMELSTSGGSDTHVVTGDNDEELRPLSWLNDKNLIKGIVTTTNGNAATAAGANKRHISSNICIVNANGTHEYIEELPPHVACEEHVTTIGSSSNNNSTTTMSLHDMPETQITTLSVSDFQQQFISSNNIGGNKRNSSSNNNSNSHQQLANLANFALAQEAAKDQQHIYNNIATLGATTTVHVGPSGTTTVVEYKSNSNFMPTQRQLINGISCSSNNVATSASSNSSTNTIANTTIMAANNSNNNHNQNNNYVPSTTSTASSANYASTCTPHTTPLKQTITLPNNVNTVVVSANSVVNGNNTTNTYYQKQSSNNNNNNSSSSTSHHPHKKYLREKMNGLDQTAGNNSSGSNSAATSVVSSPASSSSSASGSSNSTLSSSLSTGAVNGANSPVSKSSSSTYYTLIGGSGGGGAAGLAAGVGSNSSSGGGGSINYSNAFVTANTTATSQPNNNNYTILNQNQHIISSPAMSSPESSTKDYYTVQQHQQQQHHHIALKSPTSYSSYENDSLKDFEISTTNSGRLTTSTPQQQHYHQQQQQQQSHSPTPIHHHQKASAMSPTSSTSSSTAAAAPSTPQKQKHPNNVPYDPLVHTHNKPPYSFSSLIFMAIEGSMEKALPVKEIYAWIVQHFPYFKTAPTGWKNSVRHNLSLNKSFVKVEKAPNMGKGSLWRVEQQQRQNLIQALTRSPFFPNSAVDKINLKNTGGYDAIDGNATISTLTNGNSTSAVGSSGGLLSAGNKSCIDARFDARLFPKLSKVFKDMEEHNSLNDNGSGGGGGVGTDMADDDIPSDYSTTNNNNHSNKYQYNPATPMQQQQQQQQQSAVSAGSNLNSYDNIERLARDCGADSIDDVNAATAMLALKHGPKVFAETFQNGAPVITSSPSEDHTYSAGGGGGVGVGTVNTLTNGNSTSNGAATNGIANGQHVVCGDNQSNCASSDAAYESSEENHNITPEELADQQRHRDGVDALLSLSLSSFMDGNSPIKRPPSNTVEEEHISSCLENITPSIGVGKMALMSVNAVTNQHASAVYHLHQHQQHPQQLHHHHSILDEGYNTQSYYGSNNNSNSSHYMASPSTPKKPKPLRNLRAKIKRKPTWIR